MYIELDPLNLALSFRAALKPVSLDPTRLIVETGAGVPGANSYISVEDARAYFIGRRLYSSAWTVAPRDLQEAALRMASSVLDDEFTWSGLTPVNPAQGLCWPFTDATDRYGNAVVGVPKAVRDATCEVALYLLAQDRTEDAAGLGLKSLKIDVITLVFDKTDKPVLFPPYVTRMLYGLGVPVKGGGSIRNIKLYRV